MNKICIINYGMGNLTSISNSLEFHKIPYDIVNHFDSSLNNEYMGYILPGVGSFGKAMEVISKSFLGNYLQHQVVSHKKPLLGICLGMQLLFEKSEESVGVEGLGLISGKVVRFSQNNMKVPHVGWNDVDHLDNELFEGVQDKLNFYFDHSYYVVTDDVYSIAKSTYVDEFTVSVNHNNIYGVQFHAERSQIDGLRIILNFAKICGVKFA